MSFSIEDVGEFVWFLHDNKPFALYSRELRQVDQFRYKRDEGTTEKPAFPEFYHMPTFFGARTGFYGTDETGNEPEVYKEQWIAEKERLVFRRTTNEPFPSYADYVVEIAVDEKTDSLVPSYTGVFRRAKEVSIEAFNVYLAGVENEHPGFGRGHRCPHTVWRGRDGKLYRHRNSHPFTYLAVPQTRGKHPAEPRDGGMIGFAGGEQCNPIWIITECTPGPGLIATCDMWFDQHLIVERPGLEDRDDEGYFVSSYSLRHENLSEADARGIVSSAREVSHVGIPGRQRIGVRIKPEGVTRLTQTVDLEDAGVGPMACIPSWTKSARALRFEPSPQGERCLCLSPNVEGPALFRRWDPMPIYPPDRRITATFRGVAANLTAPAKVGLTVTGCSHDDVRDEAWAPSITEDGPWERTVEIDNNKFNFVLPTFQRAGEGGLWISGLELSSRTP